MPKGKEVGEREHSPMRMCIGCRRRRKKEEMLRFVRSEEGIVFVHGRKAVHGRGLYLCPDISCLNAARKRNRGIDLLQSEALLYPFVKGLQ
ncbi:MAG: YlxR family protein [Syntrophaceae bacterium]|nr:YlxR family protein [Syntrophaceae bacterium]